MNNIIDLKGSILSLTVLKLHSASIEETKQAIIKKVQQAPAFFVGIPVVLEPQVEIEDATYLALLVEQLRQLQMIPIGIRTENAMIQSQAEYTGLALFPKETRKKIPKDKSDTQDKTVEKSEEGLKSAKIVKGNVRSGQQVFAKNRDLIVMGSVNPGAEVLADGNVHVYGKVMGKIFAGASGETKAQIFAQAIDPELVCIAGAYQLNEDIADKYKSTWVEISLVEDNLKFKEMK